MILEEFVISLRDRIGSGDHQGVLNDLAAEGVNILATIDEARTAVDGYISAVNAAVAELQAAAAQTDAQSIIDDVAAAQAQLPQPPAEEPAQ